MPQRLNTTQAQWLKKDELSNGGHRAVGVSNIKHTRASSTLALTDFSRSTVGMESSTH